MAIVLRDLSEQNLVFWSSAQARPHFGSQLAVDARHREVRPPVALAFGDDLGGRHIHAPREKRQGDALGGKLALEERG